jgi:hypothetical protein
VWYDELTSTLGSYDLHIGPSTAYTEELVHEVALASVSLCRSFALAPQSCQNALPWPIEWRPLTGNPLRQRTWAVWPTASRRRDLGHLVALLESSSDGRRQADGELESGEGDKESESFDVDTVIPLSGFMRSRYLIRSMHRQAPWCHII